MYLFYSLTSRKRHFLWVTLSVFLLFQDINATVLGGAFTGSTNEDENVKSKLARRQDDDDDDDFEIDCDWKWSILKDDGECTCTSSPEGCDDDYSGMVCASNGAQYTSMCHFAWSVCYGNLDSNVTANAVCEEPCQYIRLQGSSVFNASDPRLGLGIFTYVSGSTKEDLLYSTDGMDLYYETQDDLVGWNIGRTVNGEKHVSIRFLNSENDNYPQFAGGAEIVPQKGNIWTADGSLRLVCIRDLPQVQTRFIFSLIIDTITRLQPIVSQKLENYKHDFGQGNSYKDKLDEIKSTTTMISANLVRLKELCDKVNYEKLKLLKDASKLVQNIAIDAETMLKPFTEFQQNMLQDVVINSVNVGLQIIETVYIAVKIALKTAKFATLACAAVFSVIGAIFAIIDIAHSVSQEKKQYRKALKNQRKLERANTKLDNARTKMVDVQSKLMTNLVQKMKDFSSKASSLITNNKYLTSASSKLGSIKSSSDLTFIKLSTLHDALNQINNFATEYHKQLLVEYTKQKDATDYAKNMENNFKNNAPLPSQVFETFKSQRPILLQNKYNTFTSFMVYVAKDVLKTISCYWGYDLAAYRRGNGDNDRIRICDSPELQSYTNIIKQGVQNSKPVCGISTDLPDYKHFSKLYQILFYISTYVIPSESCYYGYDLTKIRNGEWTPEQVEGTKIDRRMASYMMNAGDDDLEIEIAKETICSTLKVCFIEHLNYVGCLLKDSLDLSANWQFGTCSSNQKCTDQLNLRTRC